ncbi:MAG: xanthine dehydrogenase family protein subunit M [Thermodesulfobacteriota bacterium]
MKAFDLYEPKTVEEACTLLHKFKGKARVLAGGTDLLVEMKTGRMNPSAVINLKKIEGLDKISFSRDSGLRIGALATWTQILDSKPISLNYPLLREAAHTMGSFQVRNVATLGGNICHASPAANGAVPLLVYEAECIVQGPEKERSLPIEKMIVGVQRNGLKPGEILTEIRIPLPPPRTSGSYYKFSQRKAMDLAIVGVGTLIGTRKGAFELVRIALGAVGPKAFRARRAEKALIGKPLEDQSIREAADVAVEECSPITDIRASKEYRIELVKELTFRAIKGNIINGGRAR